MNQDQIKQNLLSGDTWLRILFMAGFAVAVWITMMVLVVIIVAQLLIVLVVSSPNPNLQRFGLLAGAYLFETLQFLLYNTDDKPFPFAPFPDPESAGNDMSDSDQDADDAVWKKTAATAETGNNAAKQTSSADHDIPVLSNRDEDETQQDPPR